MTMSEAGSEMDEALLEECIDELDEAIDRLDRFPVFVLALAMRVHLSALLHAMRVSGQIREQELRDFLSVVQLEAEGPGEDD